MLRRNKQLRYSRYVSHDEDDIKWSEVFVAVFYVVLVAGLILAALYLGVQKEVILEICGVAVAAMSAVWLLQVGLEILRLRGEKKESNHRKIRDEGYEAGFKAGEEALKKKLKELNARKQELDELLGES